MSAYFRNRAKECSRLADRAVEPEMRDAFLHSKAIWLRRAELSERLEGLVSPFAAACRAEAELAVSHRSIARRDIPLRAWRNGAEIRPALLNARRLVAAQR